ncbi:MAG: penicillin-binding protein 2 [Candidatus Spechtbacteria bacterium]|nr:penicillin-binding protein 2 [Candidatus Spechtbacteria bacterium]
MNLKLSTHWRIYFLFGLFVVAGSGIAVRLFYLQVVHNTYYAALAQGQHASFNEKAPERGRIYLQDLLATSPPNSLADKKNLPYFYAAINENKPMVYASPNMITNDGDVAEILAPILGLERNALQQKLSDSSGSYLPLARQVSDEIAQRVREENIRGIFVTIEPVRRYPGGQLASHVLGFLGYKGDQRVGQYGIEGYYDGQLRGSQGAFKNEQGSDIELTIDYNIQYFVEKKLHEVISKWSADAGSVIIMDPKTGEIKAMAGVPAFDLNTYSQVDSLDIYLNQATQKVYEPGSIMKPLTMAAAIDAGAIKASTTYTDTGEIKTGGYTIRNFDNKNHGVQTMTQVLEKSLNTGAVFASQQLGKDLFRKYLLAFGLNEKTGIDLPGELPGHLGDVITTDRDINFATASFGQGIAMSPMNFLTAFSSLANNGGIMKPHVVKAIHRADGTIEEIKPEKLGTPISARTAQEVTGMLVSVAENGYDKKANVPGYKIAAKTGTAQIPNENAPGYSDKRFHSFAGYAPADKPAFVAIITMKNPKGINFASDSLAPVFKDIASYILHYYQVPSN